jgi:bifunctional UDP-N-acetylglucosamine pyrophosphorylase/glucosamine-1-phosphate N-acetyltransferase
MKIVQSTAVLRITNEDQIRSLGLANHVVLSKASEIRISGSVAFGVGVELRGCCELGDGSRIEKGSVLSDVTLGQNNHVRPYSVLTNLTAGNDNILGPFCFVRDGCNVLNDCIIGSHVEAVRSDFGNGVKVSHQAYIGDASLGQNVIIGAGVVFCNWDGTNHQPVQIGDGTTIGSGTMLVAPLSVGKNVIVGAGSVVTIDVASGAKLIQPRRIAALKDMDGTES